MIEPKKKTIDGITFEVTLLPGTKAMEALVRISRVLGPAMAVLADRPGSSLADLPLAGMVSRGLETLSFEDLTWLSDLFGERTRFSRDGGKKWPFLSEPNRDELFAGRTTLWLKWLWFALECNYADFLEPLRGRAGAPEAPTPTP